MKKLVTVHKHEDGSTHEVNVTCKCGETLQAISIRLHPATWETLKWLIEDREQEGDVIIERLIELEGNKRRRIAAKKHK